MGLVMNYDEAITILNNKVFMGDKRNLVEKLASNPERFVGIFRTTKPRAKLIQNLLLSHEIKFGDAIESLIRRILVEQGFSTLDRNLIVGENKYLTVDQYFQKGKLYFFVEQKMRDDHDSSKKHGQMSNFKKKVDVLYKKHSNKVTGIMYFVDPSFSKNKQFYIHELKRLQSSYPIDLLLFYGKELFNYFNCPPIWKDLSSWISNWKSCLDDFPAIDLDISPEESLDEIKLIRPNYWRKLIGNDAIWDEGIIRVLFSDGTTLRLLFGYFSQRQSKEYDKIAEALLDKINLYYS